MLEIRQLHAGYGSIEILRGVDLEVGAGEIVAVLGSNGVGKSTLNNNISALYRPFSGSIRFEGQEMVGLSSSEVVRRGLIHVPEGRRIFPNLNVRENLELGSLVRGKERRSQNIERVVGIFPRLKERFDQQAGTLSGGEQQMLAIGRALMAQPSVLLLDEPSLGLSPLLTREIFAIVRRINTELGTAILVVEQNAAIALATADDGYIMELGRIVAAGTCAELMAKDDVKEFYLGGGHQQPREDGQKQRWKRRKTWR
jgi:branched-chain amino acid transport system ATP-binding protein